MVPMSSRPPHDTVILDVDGTLADSTYHHALAWARAFARVDLHPSVWRIHRTIGMGGDLLVAAVAGDEAERLHGDALRQAWEEEYDELLPEVGLLPGARDLVLALAGRGLLVTLATSGKDRFTEHVLDQLDLAEGTLAARTSSEEVETSKPAPDLLGRALEKAGGRSAVMVGDTVYDVEAASALGAPCVAVRTGGFGEQELIDAGAVLVVDSPQELVDADWDRLLSLTQQTSRQHPG
jgi:HAD superfamily hydrolase (TIGR01549 family)